VKLSGKPAVLWTRDKHRSPDQDGNPGAAADIRLRRTREGRAEYLGQLMLLLAALDLLLAVVALGVRG